MRHVTNRRAVDIKRDRVADRRQERIAVPVGGVMPRAVARDPIHLGRPGRWRRVEKQHGRAAASNRNSKNSSSHYSSPHGSVEARALLAKSISSSLPDPVPVIQSKEARTFHEPSGTQLHCIGDFCPPALPHQRGPRLAAFRSGCSRPALLRIIITSGPFHCLSAQLLAEGASR